MTIRAVLFDLDGTLLDRETSIRRFAEDQYDRYQTIFSSIPKKFFVNKFIELDDNGKIWKDEVYQKLLAEFDITGIKWPSLLDDYVSRFRDHVVPFPQLIEMLVTLKANSFVLGIISNGRTGFQKFVIDALKITDYFSLIFVSEEQGLRKPEPGIFLKALKQLKLNPEDVLFVGDAPIADIQGAQNIGMKAIWKKTKDIECDFADAEIDCLSELPNLIKKFS